MRPAQAGAGGSWSVIDEIVDPTVVKQQARLSCGAACGEMLLKERGITNITQAAIENLTGAPTWCERIAYALNSLNQDSTGQWRGGFLDIPGATASQIFDILNTTVSWMAELREPSARIGHLVIVDGQDIAGRVIIRDPWGEGTRYKMNKDDFLQFWTQQAVYWRKQ